MFTLPDDEDEAKNALIEALRPGVRQVLAEAREQGTFPTTTGEVIATVTAVVPPSSGETDVEAHVEDGRSQGEKRKATPVDKVYSNRPANAYRKVRKIVTDQFRADEKKFEGRDIDDAKGLLFYLVTNGLTDLADRVAAEYNAEFDDDHATFRLAVETDTAPPPVQKKQRFDTSAQDWNYADAWSPGQAVTSRQNALHHYAKHGNEGTFSFTSVEDYTRAALAYWESNAASAAYQATDSTKIVLADYDKDADEGRLLAVDVVNKIRTFFTLTRATMRQFDSSGDVDKYLKKKLLEL